jgi:hypothetical protein
MLLETLLPLGKVDPGLRAPEVPPDLGSIGSNARLLDESKVDTSAVSILSKVTIKNKKNGATVTYTLVSEEEADLKAGKISTHRCGEWPRGAGCCPARKARLNPMRRDDAGIGWPRSVGCITPGCGHGVHSVHFPDG